MGYKVCEYCGANLDPGEPCDCRKESSTEEDAGTKIIYIDSKSRKKA